MLAAVPSTAVIYVKILGIDTFGMKNTVSSSVIDQCYLLNRSKTTTANQILY